MSKTPLLTEKIKKLEESNAKLQNDIDELRLCVKYLQMDLEATKREMKG
jgi:predicted RNase H-like nuclease (RuvC/YqgF family)